MASSVPLRVRPPLVTYVLSGSRVHDSDRFVPSYLIISLEKEFSRVRKGLSVDQDDELGVVVPNWSSKGLDNGREFFAKSRASC